MTTINYDNTLTLAHKMAKKAKHGILKINDDVYTFEFDVKTWDYKVYKNLFLYITFNTKDLKMAKQWLKDYINN